MQYKGCICSPSNGDNCPICVQNFIDATNKEVVLDTKDSRVTIKEACYGFHLTYIIGG